MIVSIAEARVALGMTGSETDADLALLQLTLQKTDAAVRNILRYDPERKTHSNELYPVSDAAFGAQGGIWDVRGTRAVLIPNRAAGSALQLKHLPVRQITALSEDRDARAGKASGAFATALTEGTDFWADYEIASAGSDGVAANDGLCLSGLIYRSSLSWPSRARTVQVSYVGGFSAAELRGESATADGANIHDAAMDIVMANWGKFKARGKTNAGFVAGAITSEKMDKYSYQIGGSGEAAGGMAVSSMTLAIPQSAALKLSTHVNIGALVEA